MATLTTDSTGYATSDAIFDPDHQYYIKEVQAPDGYKIDTEGKKWKPSAHKDGSAYKAAEFKDEPETSETTGDTSTKQTITTWPTYPPTEIPTKLRIFKEYGESWQWAIDQYNLQEGKIRLLYEKLTELKETEYTSLISSKLEETADDDDTGKKTYGTYTSVSYTSTSGVTYKTGGYYTTSATERTILNPGTITFDLDGSEYTITIPSSTSSHSNGKNAYPIIVANVLSAYHAAGASTVNGSSKGCTTMFGYTDNLTAFEKNINSEKFKTYALGWLLATGGDIPYEYVPYEEEITTVSFTPYMLCSNYSAATFSTPGSESRYSSAGYLSSEYDYDLHPISWFESEYLKENELSRKTWSWTGTKFGVYSDAACTNLLETLEFTEDDGGYADGTKQYWGGTVVYIKEIAAPEGYELIKDVFKITIPKIISRDAINILRFTAFNKEATAHIAIQKKDSTTGNATPYNEYYSFAGAEYTIYSDSACTSAVETLTTDSSGYAESGSIDPGTYYIKETKAPTGYKLDSTVYTVTVADSSDETYVVESKEEIQKKKVAIQKKDSRTNKTEAYNSSYSFAGAVYTVYSDSSCTSAVTTMTTNTSGYAESGELPFGVYYVKETKRPQGYALDATVHKISINSTTADVVADNSAEAPFFKYIEIQKKDATTGQANPLSKLYSFNGAQYTVYSDSACTSAVTTLTTNANGYAKSGELALGTYYVKETNRPYGYRLDETVYTVTLKDENVGGEDTKVTYRVESPEQPVLKPLAVQKYDADTGKTEPYNRLVSFTGAVYTIYANPACTGEYITQITLDEKGYGKSKDLPLGTYYIKETKRPSGYIG